MVLGKYPFLGDTLHDTYDKVYGDCSVSLFFNIFSAFNVDVDSGVSKPVGSVLYLLGLYL